MNYFAKGVDISTHNGIVNFEALKKAGIEFVIIRCGYGGNLTKQDDTMFKRNVEQCRKNNIPYGVYLYSYATSVEGAKSEAEHIIRLLNGSRPAYGCWYDVEDSKLPDNKKQLTDQVVSFCEALEKAGLYVGVYSSLSWFRTRFDSRISVYDKWVAQWNSECTYEEPYGIWQFTSTLNIGGKVFDGNYAYKDYPALMKYKNPTPKKSVDEIAIEVIAGSWGNGSERSEKLTKAGYKPEEIQKRVNEYYKIASECIKGNFGNGEERKDKLRSLGFDSTTVQKIINAVM